MIVQEKIDNKLIKSYSNKDVRIRQISTGNIYDSAIDLIELNIEYEETNIPIKDIEELNDEYAEAGKILMGVID